MPDVKVYTTSYCGYCNSAKKLLQQVGLAFEEINLDDKPDLRHKLSSENNGYRTVPMIFVDNKFIGGFNELNAMHKQGKLLV